MINNETICWICKRKIGKGGSEHHLFNFYDYKQKMLDTFPDMDKKQIKNLRLKYKKIKIKIPSYKVHTKCHEELEKVVRGLLNKRLKLFKKIKEKNEFYTD